MSSGKKVEMLKVVALDYIYIYIFFDVCMSSEKMVEM